MLETVQDNVYRRVPGRPEFVSDAPATKVEISIFDLINAVSNILKRFNQREKTRDVFEDKWTVSEKIELLMDLLKSKPALRFSELFETATSRTEVVVTFLAMLELIRMKQLKITQSEPFSEIEITFAPRAVSADAEAAAEAEAAAKALPATPESTPEPDSDSDKGEIN